MKRATNKRINFDKLIKEVMSHKKEMERHAVDVIVHFKEAA